MRKNILTTHSSFLSLLPVSSLVRGGEGGREKPGKKTLSDASRRVSFILPVDKRRKRCACSEVAHTQTVDGVLATERARVDMYRRARRRIIAVISASRLNHRTGFSRFGLLLNLRAEGSIERLNGDCLCMAHSSVLSLPTGCLRGRISLYLPLYRGICLGMLLGLYIQETVASQRTYRTRLVTVVASLGINQTRGARIDMAAQRVSCLKQIELLDTSDISVSFCGAVARLSVFRS